MKKSKYLLTIAIVPLLLTGCENNPVTISKNSIPLYGNELEKMLDVEICNFSNHPDIKYINLDQAFKIPGKIIIEGGFLGEVSFSVNDNKVTRSDNNEYVFFDCDNDTISFSNYQRFIFKGDHIVSDYGDMEDVSSTNVDLLAMDKSRSFTIRYNNEEKFDLKKYDIDIVNFENKVYIPFQTFSDVFLNLLSSPYVAFENGIYLANETDVRESEIFKNGKPTQTQALLDFNYNETCFLLNTFYGMNEAHQIGDFCTYLKNNNMHEPMHKSSTDFDQTLSILIDQHFDDKHSTFMNASPMNEKEIEQIGGPTMTTSLIDFFNLVLLQSQYDKIDSVYEEEGKTAFIRFSKFDTVPTDLYEKGVPTSVDSNTDAVSLFVYAYDRISKNDDIENVVVDITTNGGGDVKCMAFIAALLSGTGVIVPFMNYCSKQLNNTFYSADANLDHKIDADDFKFFQKKVFILSSTYSFSSANALCSCLKDCPNVKIIGEKSGGGGCAILQSGNVLGTCFQISGPIQLLQDINGSYYCIDKGIEPDIGVNRAIFYDNEKLMKFLYIE